MKPDFALSLSFEGIGLLVRAPDGWRRVGDVTLDTADLHGALAALRTRGEAFANGPTASKIVLPRDQIRYLTVETGSFEGETRLRMVLSALEQATPYALDELAYDIRDGDRRSFVAAVARETLAEAEAFAVEHGFNPLSFVAIPEASEFPGEPYFGPTRHAGDQQVTPDAAAIRVVGEASAATIPAIVEEAESAPPAAFVSRRGKRSQIEAARPESRAEPPLTTPPAVAEPESEEDDFEPDFVAVAAPGLNIPDTDTELPPPAPEVAAAPGGIGAFFSRRPDPTALPEHPAPPVAAPPRAELPSVRMEQPADETERMTIFGARQQAQQVGGKPRFLGLILTLGLLVFLLAVALWAALFLDDGVMGLFRSSDDAPVETAAAPPAPELQPQIAPVAPPPRQPETAAAPVPAPPQPQPDATGRPEPEPEPEQALPQPPAPRVGQAPSRRPAPVSDIAAFRPGAEQRVTATTPAPLDTPPGLSETGTAVLDALRSAEPDGPAAPAAPLPTAEPVDPEPPVPGRTLVAETAPDAPEAPGLIPLDDLFVAAIDRTDHSQDAVAMLPQDSFLTDPAPGTVASPPRADTTFTLDARGLVVPTPEGALTPDGVLVFLGKPPLVPPPTPERQQAEPPQAEADAEQIRLAGLRPRARPEDLVEQTERTQLGGLTREELGTLRPRLRPAVLAALAQAQRAAEEPEEPQAEATEPETPPEEAAQAPEEPIGPTSALAVATVRKPASRPRNFAARVERTRAQRPEPAAPAVPRSQTVAPNIPSTASVARQATLNNAINLRRVNLIGVYGTPSNRRALVRLPSGRYKKVKVGDSVDGGRIVAIGDSELRYQKGGRNVTLKIPSG